MEDKKRFALDPKHSDKGGLLGLYEMALRRFQNLIHMATLVPFYLIASACLGAAFAPGAFLLIQAWDYTASSSVLMRVLALSASLGVGFFMFAFTLIIVVPFANFILPTRLKPWKGTYYSLETVKWYMHNGLTYLVRLTILEFLTPTPYNILFYRLMGMKLGRGCQFNTTFISDPCLITLGNKVTVGGSATICAHYGVGGVLVLAPVKIGDGATIGLKSTIMGGVEVGAGAKILPNSVLLPKTIVPAGETWGGVPAQKIDLHAKKVERVPESVEG